MAEDVVLLEPGDERAQKIAKAMGSQMASDILKLLSEGPKSLSDITERLAIPMTTAKYHVENLLDAGLLNVAETKYSVKGREIKLYSLTNQLLIVAPRHSNVRSLLLKYASLFGIVSFGSLIIGIMTPLFSADSMMRSSMNAVPRMAVQQSVAFAA
ncbi:MAG: helix-turn-helix domain-containing protein, partial [Methanoregula sp.]|nr:helix-turn-helix domain-containing protein [Methanoregula sp.]